MPYKKPLIRSGFDVALWLRDTALQQQSLLQPRLMYHLLFLAQAYYAACFDDQKLIPATFLTTELGPVEPTLYAILSTRFPKELIATEALPATGLKFLEPFYHVVGKKSAGYVEKIACRNPAYTQALRQGLGVEVPFESLGAVFRKAARPFAPAPEEILHTLLPGQRPSLKPWVPGRDNRGPRKPEDSETQSS